MEDGDDMDVLLDGGHTKRAVLSLVPKFAPRGLLANDP